MLELNLVTNALARTLVDEGAARVANAEKRRLSSGAALTNASPRQPKTPRPTRIAGSQPVLVLTRLIKDAHLSID